MRAVRIFKPGDIGLVREEIPVPKKREVLVEVICAGICGTDYGIFNGELSELVDFPLRPGHEWTGVVKSVGEEVVLFSPGDRVVGQTCVACGQCEDCRAGNRLNCKNRRSVGTVHAWPGAMCDFELFSEGDLIKLPESISFKEGALIEPAGNAMMGIEMAKIGVGSTVCVMGTGPIGLSAVAIARALGAKTVISVGRSVFKLETAKKMGATHVINSISENVGERMLEITSGEGVDATLEISGSKELLSAAFYGTKNFGDIELIAFYEGKYEFDLNDFAFRLQTLRASGCGGWGYFKKVMELMEQKRINLLPMITHEVSLNDTPTAIRELKKDNAEKIKVMINVKEQLEAANLLGIA